LWLSAFLEVVVGIRRTRRILADNALISSVVTFSTSIFESYASLFAASWDASSC
jgi:hypothetical protein